MPKCISKNKGWDVVRGNQFKLGSHALRDNVRQMIGVPTCFSANNASEQVTAPRSVVVDQSTRIHDALNRLQQGARGTQ